MIKRLFVGLWNSLNFIRRFLLNALLVLVIVLIASGVWEGLESNIEPNTALRLAPYGVVVEQYQGDPVETAISQALGESTPQTRLFDLLKAIKEAASDDNISGIVLETDGLWGAGPAQLQDIASALTAFKATGKPVYAYGSRYSKEQYYLAAQANEVFLDPYGEVLIDGFSVWNNYYADGAAKLKASVNVFRVGEYKSAVEPWLRNDMSPAAREANQAWLQTLWQSWRDTLAATRDIAPLRLDSFSQDFDQLLKASEGDGALAAQATGLVDRLATPQQFREQMIEQFGSCGCDGMQDYKQIGLYGYLADIELKTFQAETVEPKPKIAVVTIDGALMEGAYGVGYADIDSAIYALEDAAHNDDVAAVVVRVNSPGGTVTAAESLRRAVAYVKTQNKPIYVSMSTVTASGGYWLATAADQIWAQPDTLTGSIGIYGVVPTFENSLAELGVYTDGVATSPFAGGFRVDRALSQPVKNAVQAYIENGYQRFIKTVADARGMTAAEVERAASGRVWIGSKALELGLVDQLGGLEDVIKSIAQSIDLESYSVELDERELGWMDSLIVELGGGISLPESFKQQSRFAQWLDQKAQLGLVQQLAQRSASHDARLRLSDVAMVWWPGTLQ